jgi:hypothetical protein
MNGKFCPLTVKKKATLAEAVAGFTSPSAVWKLKRIAIIIMDTPSPREPHIMGFRRPVRSSVNVGTREPRKNIRLMTPPRRRERFLSRPTLSSRTDVI